MPLPGHYTETTSLEFILNPFKLFFTAYVVHVTTSLEMGRHSPTIYARDVRVLLSAPRTPSHLFSLPSSYTLQVSHSPTRVRFRYNFSHPSAIEQAVFVVRFRPYLAARSRRHLPA